MGNGMKIMGLVVVVNEIKMTGLLVVDNVVKIPCGESMG